MKFTLVEKIATRHAIGLASGEVARSGNYITIRPRHVMTHDNTGAVIPKFHAIGASRVSNPRQPVFAIDHDIQNQSPENLAKYERIAAFARDHGIDFYPAGTGISHQIMVEEGYVVPGSMVVGSDSHSNLYGALSALGTPVVRTDAACLWATSQTWWQVPPVARVRLEGNLTPGVVGKDVIIALCGLFRNDEVLNHAVEFVGDGMDSLSMDHRMSIANMTTEWGALAGVFPFDEILRDYLFARADLFAAREGPARYGRKDVEEWFENRIDADGGATYAVELLLDLSTVIPHVSGPNGVKTMTSLPEMEKRRLPIQKAYLLSCVNARLEDLAEAARVVRGKKVAEGVEFYVAAASAEIQRRAEEAGHWGDLVEAGAKTLPSGCGPCIGLGTGTMESGEVGISATNRNFKGRMGSRDAEVYLASPAVVAASAVAGYIRAPSRFEERVARVERAEGAPKTPRTEGVEIIPGFPEVIEGRSLFLDVDNLNTDGIYAGKWTYRDDMTREEMANVVFENYDPAFASVYQTGDIIVAGKNFGAGSSREQAATALKFKGIPCVVAASFSETYKRNAFNNGFAVFECPHLVRFLRDSIAEEEAATRVGPRLRIDFERSVVECEGETFSFPPLGRVPQELIVEGGAESMVRRRLAERAG